VDRLLLGRASEPQRQAVGEEEVRCGRYCWGTCRSVVAPLCVPWLCPPKRDASCSGSLMCHDPGMHDVEEENIKQVLLKEKQKC